MADENDEESTQTETPVVETPAPTPPSYVPADEFKLFQSTITNTLGTIQESLQALNSSRVHEAPRAEAPVPFEDASDEEIESALAEGKGAKVFRKAIEAAVKRLDAKYDARHSNLEQTAGTSLSNMAARMAKPLMKYYDKPYIKKEVDAYIAQLPAKDKLNPENFVVVYNAVAGAHMDEIIADEREAALRASASKGAPTPGGASGRSSGSASEPTIEEEFGAEAARELRSRGRDLDRIAQAFGFKDGKEYMKYKRESEGSDNVQ